MSRTPASAVLPAGRHDTMIRLHRIEGQVRGIERMVEQDRYCIDVLTQISAVSRALQSLALILLEEHLRHCLADSPPEVTEARLKEASDAIARLVRS
jgi:DNA-binding FrmR family transcriptional regulator